MKILIAENNDTFRKKVCDYVKHMDASIEITESNNLHNVFSFKLLHFSYRYDIIKTTIKIRASPFCNL